MDSKTFDWKDVANSQFEKAFTLALLLLLFGIMVTPKVEIRKQQFKMQEMQAIELPPEERERIKPPEDIVKPVVDITIDEELGTDETTDPDVIAQLKSQFGDIWETTNAGNTSGSDKPFNFEPYEDPPEPINPIAPEYPPLMIKTGVEGLVYLEVDVYKDGSIGNVNVIKSLLSGPGGLDEAAVNAVRKWKFQPGRSGGKPIDTTVIIPIEFTLNN
jgi:protein TonB